MDDPKPDTFLSRKYRVNLDWPDDGPDPMIARHLIERYPEELAIALRPVSELARRLELHELGEPYRTSLLGLSLSPLRDTVPLPTAAANDSAEKELAGVVKVLANSVNGLGAKNDDRSLHMVMVGWDALHLIVEGDERDRSRIVVSGLVQPSPPVPELDEFVE